MHLLALEGAERVVVQEVVDLAQQQHMDERTQLLRAIEDAVQRGVVRAFGVK